MRTRCGATVLVAIVALTGAACASPGEISRGPAEPKDVIRASSSTNDPVLDRAATEIDGLLRTKYAQWYSGKVLEHSTKTMTIFRKPGSDLDTAVRARVTDVRIRFADARLSEAEMLALTDRIMADIAFWRERGIDVNGAGPMPDGSAVKVRTPTGTKDDADKLERHYQRPIVVERGSAVPAGA